MFPKQKMNKALEDRLYFLEQLVKDWEELDANNVVSMLGDISPETGYAYVFRLIQRTLQITYPKSFHELIAIQRVLLESAHRSSEALACGKKPKYDRENLDWLIKRLTYVKNNVTTEVGNVIKKLRNKHQLSS